MRIFKEVQLAPVCYPIEALYWIVKGLAPEIFPDDTGHEARGNPIAYANEYDLGPELLTPSELSRFHVPLSYDDYLDLETGVSLREEDLPALITPLDANSVEAWQSEWRAIREKENAERQLRIDAALSEFHHEIERAKTTVSAAIMSGKVKIKGFWAETVDEFYDMCHAAMPDSLAEEIDPHAFSQSAFDWNENTLETRANSALKRLHGKYFLITMNTAEMMQTFQPPSDGQKTMSVFCGNAVLTGDESSYSGSVSRGRGRPPKADWLQDAMRAWYLAQCKKGALGENKQDAEIAAAQEWAKNVGQEVSRTTVQTYLSGLLGRSRPK